MKSRPRYARLPSANTRPGVALFITTLSSFLTAFTASGVTIALPAISAEYSLSAVRESWIGTAFLLATAVFLMPTGKLADIIGRRKVFLAGLTVYAVSSLLTVFAGNGVLFILCRSLQGIGGAMVFGTSGAIVVSVYPPESRGRAIGINTAAVYTGLSAGPFLGGILTQSFGWRSLFYLNVGLGVLCIALIVAFIRDEWAESRGQKLDLTGSLIYGAALAALITGFSLLPGWIGFLLTAAGLGGLAAFFACEYRSHDPLFDVRLFVKNRVFAFSNLAALINYSATFAVGFFLSQYLQYVKDLSPRDAGLVLVSQPVIQAVLSPVTGWLSERIEPRILASAGMLLCSAGLAILIVLQPATPVVFVVSALLLLGAGFALFSSPNTNAVMSSVDRSVYGVATATLGTMRVVGQMFSMATATMLSALYLGQKRISSLTAAEFMKSLRAGFFLFAVLCLAGVFLSLARGRIHRGRA